MAFSTRAQVGGRRIAVKSGNRLRARRVQVSVMASVGPGPESQQPEIVSVPSTQTSFPQRTVQGLLAASGLGALGAFIPFRFGGDDGNNNNNNGNGGNGGNGDGNGPEFQPSNQRERFVIAAADEEEEEEVEEVEVEEEVSGEEEEEGAASTSAAEGGEGEDQPKGGRTGQVLKAEEEEDSYPANPDQFYCTEIKAIGLPEGKGIPTADELFAGLKCQPGFQCSRQELSEDLKSLMQTQLFENVTARTEYVKGTKGKVRILVTFQQRIWPPLKSFKVQDGSGRNATLAIPSDVVSRVMEEYRKMGNKPTDMGVLALMRNTVEGWYSDRGYGMAYVTTFDGLDSGNVVANVVEGKVTRVNLVPVDENGNPTDKSGLDLSFVRRELRDIIKVGDLYSVEDSRKALKELMQSGLFENMQVLPKQSPSDETKVELDVMVKERPARTAEVECEWGFAPNERGRPTLASIVPGGNLMFEHRNLGGNGTQLSAQLQTQNFLQPDDLSFNVNLRRPYVFGYEDEKKTALSASAFNARKVSPIFTSDKEEVPPVFVDRTGAKLTLSESYSRNSKGSLSLVLEQVDCRDESGAHAPYGMRMAQGERQEMQQGPPTTLSSSGQDRVAFLQGDIVRDATYFKGPQLVGARDIFTVEQGLGIGTGFPLFNRMVASVTRFTEVPQLPVKGKTPAVLVVHAKAGNAIGDVASYDYFTLGGPFSCRGYNIGELGAARRFVEGSVELRYPLPKINQLGYAFYELSHDLGSSKELRGNPTQFYRRNGSGASWGLGVKLGAMRVEYARDCNAGKGNVFVRFGERY